MLYTKFKVILFFSQLPSRQIYNVYTVMSHFKIRFDQLWSSGERVLTRESRK